MRPWRFRAVYFVILPSITVAASVLGYYSWKTASQFAQLGEETIAQSTLLIVNEKVDQIEQQIIAADNAVFNLIDHSALDSFEDPWIEVADEVSPSVLAVLVLDDSGNALTYAHRGDGSAKRRFRKTFFDRIVADLELERQRTGRLRHLHQTYGRRSYLVAYKAFRIQGRRRYVVMSHDMSWITDEQFPSLFATEEGKRLYNVVDEDNRRVYGENLARAGDYLVGRRFPTTLYQWRLQVAPKQAPLLEAEGRTRRLNETGLIILAFLVILSGMAFLLYAADKERRLNALKADFIANVSHELKTPLSVIRMFGELLLTKRVRSEEKQKQYLEIVCRESERLSVLIENVLDFAALERGMRSYDMSEGSVVDVVARAIDTFRYRIETQGTELRLAVNGEIPHTTLDEQAIMLAVINLLDNAVKYGEGTPVTVSIESADGFIRVMVQDRGPGIPPGDLTRVFDRFYRTRRTANSRGSGIGLALVKHIAEAHGGRAWADNTPEGGASVGISLAVRAPTEHRAAPRDKPVPAPS